MLRSLKWLSVAVSFFALTTAAFADPSQVPNVHHVLLISIDGMHALDYINCVKGGYCPNLSALAQHGVNYLDASASKPSDSFPGLTAIVSGSSPRTGKAMTSRSSAIGA